MAKRISRRKTSRARPAQTGPEKTPVGRRSYRKWTVVGLVGAVALIGAVWAMGREVDPQIYDYQIVNVYPHDPTAFCQGLVFHQGFLYESTGQYGDSSLRQVELETGRVLKQVQLDDRLFGEGLTVWNNQLVQLTWRRELAIWYDAETLQETKRVRYTGQGWGATCDSQHVITSDGSSVLRFRDPDTFQVVRQLRVRRRGWSVRNLNELEYVNGLILANVWHRDYIVGISPKTGNVTAVIDLSGLFPPAQRPDREAVLNGIAYDEQGDRLFVTGKNWPKLFEIRLVPRER